MWWAMAAPGSVVGRWRVDVGERGTVQVPRISQLSVQQTALTKTQPLREKSWQERDNKQDKTKTNVDGCGGRMTHSLAAERG